MEVAVDNKAEVVAVGSLDVAVSNAADVVVTDDSALDITVTKKEYKIVGDEVYIAKLYEDAPQWMRDLVQLVVDNTMETESVMLRNDLIGQLNQFATSYVPLNAYTQSIIDLSNADTAMHDTLETLNSNFNDGLDTANSQIIDLQSTKASKTEVATKVIETLTAQLATPTSELGATIGNLQQAIVDGDSANADSVTTLMSVLEGEVDARASAIDTINTYVGIDSAGASTGTGLSAYLVGSDGNVGSADSQVANGIAIVGGVPTSKWQYNSALVVNGTTYNSGFGLSNSTGTGIGSEFWIDATKLKFTNSATTGRTAPFTIDASGVTPQITFNGKVSFSNVSGAPGGSGNLLYNSAPMLANEMKGWSIGWYNTGIVPALGAGFDSWRPSGGGSVYAVVPGAPTIGGLFDLAQTTKVSVISGKWYEASAYISSHRCTSYVTIAWYDSNNAYIGEAGGTQIAYQSNGALANWGRSTLLAQAPANAARALFYVRSAVSSTDPYCFVAFAYLGQAVQGQAVFSDWSEGTSAGVSSGEVVNDINNGNTTTINGGRITTGSITANQIAANAITANQIAANTITGDRFSSTTGTSSVWTGGGLVSQNFDGNVYGNIGTPTQGFRLSSNAAGTSSDPNIYGAYIKGAILEGTSMNTSDIKVIANGYPSNFGPIMLSEIYGGGSSLVSSIFRNRVYSFGYHSKRMCSTSQTFVLQAVTGGGFSIYGSVTTTCNIYVSVNGGGWVLITSNSGTTGLATCSITYVVDSLNDVQFMSTHSSNAVQSSSFSIQSINGQ